MRVGFTHWCEHTFSQNFLTQFVTVAMMVNPLSTTFSTAQISIYHYVKRCAIWYHLYNLKNVKNTHGGVLLLVKLQAKTWNFTRSIIPPWLFFIDFKFYKWCQIAQKGTALNKYRVFTLAFVLQNIITTLKLRLASIIDSRILWKSRRLWFEIL